MSNIAADLEALKVPIGELETMVGNPRKGDVDAVKRSYRVFGQRKPIVARRKADGRGEVIAGNHQLLAARALGWSDIAVVWTDDNDLKAKAFALADNRTADLGKYDKPALAAMLADVALDADMLDAASYSIDDLTKLLDTDVDTSDNVDQVIPQYMVLITCQDEDQQFVLIERLSAEGLKVRALSS